MDRNIPTVAAMHSGDESEKTQAKIWFTPEQAPAVSLIGLRRDRKAFKITAMIMAHGLALAAHAQTTPETTNNAAKLPDVVVKGQQEQLGGQLKPEAVESPRYTEPLRDIPQTITVVPRALIEQQNATSLRDVLRNVPGISYQAGEGGVPAGDNLSIRGFNARTDLFVDNVRDFGGYSRDPFNFEQVEVSKGPTATYAGRGSTGGSVNMVSKHPDLERFYGASFGLGTEEYKRLTIDANQPIPNSPIKGTAVRVNGMWNESDVAGRDEVRNEHWGIAPSVSFGLATPTRLTLSYFHLEQDNLPDYGIPWVPTNTGPLAAYGDKPAPVPFDSYYGLVEKDFEKTRTDIPTAFLEHDFNDMFSLRNTTRYGRNDRDSVITAPRFIDLDPTTNSVQYGNAVTRQNQSRDMVDTIFANQSEFVSRFDTWKFDHTLITALDYAHETSVNYARTGAVINTTLFNPNPNTPYPFEIRRNGIRAKAKADTISASLFDTIKFGEHWQAMAGVRYDHFESEFISLTNGRPAMRQLSRTDNMVSWRAGLVYKPVEQGSIYVGAGTSFNPSAEGLTLSTGINAANNFETDPEESRSIELGTKWELFDRRMLFTLALFRTEKTNARTDDPVENDPVVLEGEQYVNGIEVGLAGKVTQEWGVSGGYSFTPSKITESLNPNEVGNRLSNTPENSFTLWTTYDLPWHFQMGFGAFYSDTRYTSNLNTRRAPSYVTCDAMAAWMPNKHFTLRLNVNNLTDEEYIQSPGGGHFIPGAGRFGTLTASLLF